METNTAQEDTYLDEKIFNQIAWTLFADPPPHKIFLWDDHEVYVDCLFPNPVYGHFLGGRGLRGARISDVLPRHAAKVVSKMIKKILRTHEPAQVMIELHDLTMWYQARIRFLPLSRHVLGIVTDKPQRWSRQNSKLTFERNLSIEKLTRQERNVIEEVLSGKGNMAIGHRLGIAERTVKFHLTNAYRKLKVSSRPHLMALHDWYYLK